MQSQAILGKFYTMLCSILQMYAGRHTASQSAWLPALQRLTTSFVSTARIATDAVEQSSPAADPQQWISLMAYMLGGLKLMQTISPVAQCSLVPLPGMGSELYGSELYGSKWQHIIHA